LYFGEIFLGLVPLAADVMPYLPFSVANAVVDTAEGFGDGGFGSTATIDSATAIGLAFVYLLGAVAVAAVAAYRAQITRRATPHLPRRPSASRSRRRQRRPRPARVPGVSPRHTA
jgi:hypothetical protein